MGAEVYWCSCGVSLVGVRCVSRDCSLCLGACCFFFYVLYLLLLYGFAWFWFLVYGGVVVLVVA